MMKIEHIAMYVNDLEAAKDFFITYLHGTANNMYHNPQNGFRSYFISFDDGARLEVMNRPELSDIDKDMYRMGVIHIAFNVGSTEKVDELTTILKDAGYQVISAPRTTGDGYYESCIIAVEGNQIEITV